MSKYTTEVRYICENYASLRESVGYNGVAEVLEKSWNKVFDFSFPIFDETYRKPLCKKILKHFYTREICEETVGLWKLRLDARMNEIMPYFNKLYDSELIAIEPLINNRYKEVSKKEKSGTDNISGNKISNESTSNGGTVIRTGGYTDTHSGTDTNVKSGNETLRKAGKESETKTGEITKTKKGKIIDTRTGQGKTTEQYEGLGGKVSEENTDLFTDTPQGTTLNMGTSYSSIPNSTNVPIVGQDSAYLTTAEKVINEKEDLSKWKKENGFADNYQLTDTRQYGEQPQQGEYEPYTETENYGDNGVKIEKEFTNREDTKTYNDVTDETTKDLTDERTYNSMTDTTAMSGTKGIMSSDGKNVTYGSVDDYVNDVVGSKGISDSKLLKEFRDTFLNIDEMIINRLENLFMLVW